MRKDKLKLILRMDFDKCIRKNFMKDNCENCNSNENLHLHHVYKFSVQLERALDILKYSDKENFNDEEIMILRYVMLGMQCKNNDYITLCDKCHKSHHKKTSFKESKYGRNHIPENLDEIMLDYLSIPLVTNDKKELSDKLKLTDNYGRLLKWKGVKQILIKNGYKIKDTTKCINGKITKISIITK